ncbi:DUF445 domain-containing protein [Anaerosalibacter bizertensis]|uniref:DUF445 domain-containing protein n=1 Tax=Anaerosalibacter bizertensis TaxID=932217 RepID=A0A9Q4AA89_9FIRM|nr:DUF445 family protein [Anaerosalibacter bizertensis]MBV1816491.1 DUF445 domain-containing protein [Bacteroidales bacterium MSK.15.36]MCB5558551.1 DUF445 domain-containing protein [Anaerosalibacter bizertensis]MCG4563880.1 DUF445 domain-containing protein [Anaerosalibacter bizertensis]MCG4581468.1 DUF445 domain-containing protein [Anaerosalibacter bizertensis]
MKFIIPILVGGVIGYITNWLAIKMLFRPYYEKKFLGIHVPFTPGLIPKEKSRIAKSVGNTIGVYLLSPEVVTQAISSDKINNQIRSWIICNINKLKESDMTIKDFIMDFDNENYSKSLDILEKKITDFIYSHLKGERFKNGTMNLIEDKISHKPIEHFYEPMEKKVEKFMSNLSKSDEIRVEVKNTIDKKIYELSQDDRTLEEVIPSDVVNSINEYIDKNSEYIANSLRDLFESPSINMKIRESINEFVSQNVSRAITIFINSEMISNKIFDSIEKYIYNPENNKNIILIIKSLIDKFLESEISNIVLSISSNIDDENRWKISDAILERILNKENQGKVFSIVEEKIKSSESDIKEGIIDLISDNIDGILNSETLYNNIKLIICDSLKKFVEKPISYMLESVEETTVEKIINFSKVIFEKFIKNKLPDIIESFNISKVVEDEINKFDVAFAEEIILEIASKELKAITWLGALLGGIMGILSPILQLI